MLTFANFVEVEKTAGIPQLLKKHLYGFMQQAERRSKGLESLNEHSELLAKTLAEFTFSGRTDFRHSLVESYVRWITSDSEDIAKAEHEMEKSSCFIRDILDEFSIETKPAYVDAVREWIKF